MFNLTFKGNGININNWPIFESIHLIYDICYSIIYAFHHQFPTISHTSCVNTKVSSRNDAICKLQYQELLLNYSMTYSKLDKKWYPFLFSILKKVATSSTSFFWRDIIFNF